MDEKIKKPKRKNCLLETGPGVQQFQLEKSVKVQRDAKKTAKWPKKKTCKTTAGDAEWLQREAK